MSREGTAWRSAAGEATWDLHKAYDSVNRSRVAGHLRALGYPELQLRISLASYFWPRLILMGQLRSRWITAAIGLMAGSTFATLELYGMTIPSCDELVKVFPTLDLTVHVDDICLADEEESQEALMEVTVPAAMRLAQSLREEGLEIALPKCFTLGSTKEIAAGIASSLGAIGGLAGTSVRRLGVDHSLGPRRK